jgi:membrane fusion protein (multidrug efflux system)
MLKNVRNIAGLSVLALLASCGNKKDNAATSQAAKPIPVVLDTVQTSTTAYYYDQYPGTVTALKEVTITSQVNGYITGIFFKDGQNVKAGQLLYTIDQQVYNANLQTAQAQVATQEANLVKAQKDADNYHKLDQQDAIAKQQVYYADAALESAKKQVAAAKAQVDAMRANVKFSNIYAPFNGTIGISSVRVGTAVVAGQTVLNSVSTNNPIAVDFNVDQSLLYQFEKLMQSADAKTDTTFSLAFGPDVYPSYGHVYTIDRAVDQQTGTIKVRLVFDNNNNMLKPGMTGVVRILHNAGAQTILVPAICIVEQLGEYNVYVVGDSNKVMQQHVTIGQTIGANTVIKSGLAAGQKIVVQGQQNLHNGSVIMPTSPNATPTPNKQ